MIKLALNETLTAYLKKEFNTKSDIIKLNRGNHLGKFICAHVKYSNEVPAEQIGNLTLIIPDTDVIHAEIKNDYFRAEDYRSIVDYIQASFDLKVERFFVNGQRLGIQKKMIIDSFINYYELPITSANFEMLKKRDLRKRQNILKILSETIEKC